MSPRERDLAYAARPQRGAIEPLGAERAPARTPTSRPRPALPDAPGNGARVAAARDVGPAPVETLPSAMQRSAAPLAAMPGYGAPAAARPTSGIRTSLLGNGARAAAARDAGEREPEAYERFSGIVGESGLVAYAPPGEGGGMTLILPPEEVRAPAPAPSPAPAKPPAATEQPVVTPVDDLDPATTPTAARGEDATGEPVQAEETLAQAAGDRNRGAGTPPAGPPVSDGAIETPAPAGYAAEAGPTAMGDAADGSLAAWSARVTGSITRIPHPNIVSHVAHVEAIGRAGNTATARWKKKVADVPKEAKKVLEAKPIAPLSEIPPMPSPDPVPEATVRVQSKSGRSLPDQRLPDLQNTPRGFKPTVGGPPLNTRAPAAPAKPPPAPAKKSKTPVKKANETIAKEPAPAPVAGQGQTITGSERPAVHAIAAPHRADLARVLARVFDEASQTATLVIHDARARAYTDLDLSVVRGLETFGDDLIPAETSWFRDEMTRVAEAAQIGKQALDDAVAARHKELADAKDTAAQAIATESQAQSEQVGKSAGDARATIKAMRQSWDEHFDRIAADAKGGVDPKAVREEELRLDDILRKHATEHISAWIGMRKERYKKLDRALEDQVVAYKEAALADESEQLQASVTQLSDPALVTWFADRRRETGHRVGVLKEEVQNWTDGWKAEMEVARDEAIDLVRAWADQRIGRERNWFEKLLARVFAAIETKHEETAALADTQTAETVTALGQDLQVLNDLKLKGTQGLDRDETEHLARQDAEQQKLLEAYFTSTGADKGDTVLYLAKMMQLRLRRQRAPEAIKSIRAKVLQLDNVQYWSELESIGRSQNSTFSAQRSADMLWQAFEHTWGTDEDKAYAAVQGFTAEQGKAVRGLYKVDHGEDLDKRLDSEMSDEEYDRVAYGLDGKLVEADAAALRDAVEGAGTDEDLINRVLRNKTSAERIAIAEAYKSLYGEDLTSRLHDELSGDEQAITDAHLEGNTARADAIEIKMAREGFWGPNEDKIAGVYTRVRDEATQYGDARGWKSNEIDVEIARRTGQIGVEYKDTTKRELLTDLEQTFSPPSGAYASAEQREAADQYWKGRRDLVLGLATGDLVRADAGKIQIERTGIYAKDDTINGVLALQYDRAYDREKRDAMVDFTEANPGRKPTKEEQAAIETSVKARAEAQGKRNMAALGLYFETNYTAGKQSFKETIRDLTSGVDEEKADALIDQGGHLQDWQILEFATKGNGTDEDAFQKLLKSKKTKAEIDALEKEWQAHGHAGETIKELIDDETSGRLQNDLSLDYEFGGEPEDPHTVVAKAKKQLEFERESGGEQEGQDIAGRPVVTKNHEFQVLERRLARLQQDAADYEASKKLPENDPRRAWALSKWEASAEGFKSAIETHRILVDQRTELVAQVVSMAVTIVVAVVLTVVTAGAGTPAAIALIAGVSSLFGAAAGIATKMAMKGKAYGADELGMDIALGVVDSVVSAATAGFGGKLLKSATTAAKVGGAGAKGAMATLGRMAEGNLAQRAAAHFVTEGAEGFLQSLPTAILGTALNEQTWKEGNPFLNLLIGVGTGVGIGTFASGTIGALTNLKKAPHIALPHDAPHVPPKSALIDMHDNPGKLADIEARYFEANPTHTKADFRHNYDGALLKIAEHDPEFAARLHSQLRDEITELVPPQHRALLGDSPVEMWEAKRFEDFTGSQSGQAVVIIKDGHPTVIVKQGADRQALAQEGFHLLQALDPKTRAKVARLDEATLARWSTMDPREKLQLYREKLDLELDAQRQLVDALESRAGRSADDSFADRLASERATLENLEHRLGEIERISPLQRTLMAWGLVYEPRWLDQPARLFAKRTLSPLERSVMALAKANQPPVSRNLADAEKRVEEVFGRLGRAEAQRTAAALEGLYDALGKVAGTDVGWIERTLVSVGDVLDPRALPIPPGLGRGARERLVGIGMSFITPTRITRTTMEQTNQLFQALRDVLERNASSGTRRGPSFAKAVLTTMLGAPSETPLRLLKAAARITASSALDNAALDGVARAMGSMTSMKNASEFLEAIAELGAHAATPSVIGSSNLPAILGAIVGSPDPLAALRKHVELMAMLPAGATSMGSVPLFGFVRALGEAGPGGPGLMHRIAQLETTGSVDGLSDWAMHVFIKQNKTGVDVVRTLRELHVAALYAGEVATAGGKVRIDADAIASGAKSFDMVVSLSSSTRDRVHLDVMSPADAVDVSGLLGPMTHSLQKARATFGPTFAGLTPDTQIEAAGVITFGKTITPRKGAVPVPLNVDGTYVGGDLLADLAAKMTREHLNWRPLSRYVMLAPDGKFIGSIFWNAKLTRFEVKR
jgi:hypothetical protein